MGLLLGYWQCGIGNVVLRLAIYDGAGMGLLGLLRVAAGAAGLVRDGASFAAPRGRG